ncbi:hypothetical protein [Vibrio alginolyticus]|nr:hypothetical protein [Vibrio alginolyticus]MCG6335462.1 hypothetical protein [Vibrio alginolyticus]
MTSKNFLSRVQAELMDNGKDSKGVMQLASKNLIISDLAIKLYLRYNSND